MASSLQKKGSRATVPGKGRTRSGDPSVVPLPADSVPQTSPSSHLIETRSSNAQEHQTEPLVPTTRTHLTNSATKRARSSRKAGSKLISIAEAICSSARIRAKRNIGSHTEGAMPETAVQMKHHPTRRASRMDVDTGLNETRSKGSSLSTSISSDPSAQEFPHVTVPPSTRLIIRIPPRLKQTVVSVTTPAQENQTDSQTSSIQSPPPPQSLDSRKRKAGPAFIGIDNLPPRKKAKRLSIGSCAEGSALVAAVRSKRRPIRQVSNMETGCNLVTETLPEEPSPTVTLLAPSIQELSHVTPVISSSTTYSSATNSPTTLDAMGDQQSKVTTPPVFGSLPQLSEGSKHSHNSPAAVPSARLTIRIPPRLTQGAVSAIATQGNQLASETPSMQATSAISQVYETYPAQSPRKRIRSGSKAVSTLIAIAQVIRSSARIRAKRNAGSRIERATAVAEMNRRPVRRVSGTETHLDPVAEIQSEESSLSTSILTTSIVQGPIHVTPAASSTKDATGDEQSEAALPDTAHVLLEGSVETSSQVLPILIPSKRKAIGGIAVPPHHEREINHSSTNQPDIVESFPNKRLKLGPSPPVDLRHNSLPSKASRKRFRDMPRGHTNRLEISPSGDGGFHAGYPFTFTAIAPQTAGMPPHNNQHTSQAPDVLVPVATEQSGLFSETSDFAEQPSVTQVSNDSAVFDIEPFTEDRRQDTLAENFNTTGTLIAPSEIAVSGGKDALRAMHRLPDDTNVRISPSSATLNHLPQLPEPGCVMVRVIESNMLAPSAVDETGNNQYLVSPLDDVSNPAAASNVQSMGAQNLPISDSAETSNDASTVIIPKLIVEVHSAALLTNTVGAKSPPTSAASTSRSLPPQDVQAHDAKLDTGYPMQVAFSASESDCPQSPLQSPSTLNASDDFMTLTSSTRNNPDSVLQLGAPELSEANQGLVESDQGDVLLDSASCDLRVGSLWQAPVPYPEADPKGATQESDKAAAPAAEKPPVPPGYRSSSRSSAKDDWLGPLTDTSKDMTPDFASVLAPTSNVPNYSSATGRPTIPGGSFTNEVGDDSNHRSGSQHCTSSTTSKHQASPPLTKAPGQILQKLTSLPVFQATPSSSADNGSPDDSDFDSWRRGRAHVTSGKRRTEHISYPPTSATPYGPLSFSTISRDSYQNAASLSTDLPVISIQNEISETSGILTVDLISSSNPALDVSALSSSAEVPPTSLAHLVDSTAAQPAAFDLTLRVPLASTDDTILTSDETPQTVTTSISQQSMDTAFDLSQAFSIGSPIISTVTSGAELLEDVIMNETAGPSSQHTLPDEDGRSHLAGPGQDAAATNEIDDTFQRLIDDPSGVCNNAAAAAIIALVTDVKVNMDNLAAETAKAFQIATGPQTDRGISPANVNPKSHDPQRRDPNSKSLHSSLHIFVKSLLGGSAKEIQVPTSQQLLQFKHQRNGPSLDNLLLDLAGDGVKTPWNKAVAALVAERYIAEGQGGEDKKKVRKAFLIYLQQLQNVYKAQTEVGPAAIARRDMLSDRASDGRKYCKRNRRFESFDAFLSVLGVKQLRENLRRIPSSSMSGDEYEDESKKRFVTSRPVWRSKEARDFYEICDALSMAGRYTSNDRPTSGRFPAPRILSDRLDKTDAPSGLPENFYDMEYLEFLSDEKREELNVQPKISLKVPVSLLRIAERYRDCITRDIVPLPWNHPRLDKYKEDGSSLL